MTKDLDYNNLLDLIKRGKYTIIETQDKDERFVSTLYSPQMIGAKLIKTGTLKEEIGGLEEYYIEFWNAGEMKRIKLDNDLRELTKNAFKVVRNQEIAKEHTKENKKKKHEEDLLKQFFKQ